MNTSHLETANRQQSPEYRTLRQMLDRCYRESYPKFHRYGGRGIKVCDRWRIGEGEKTGVECFIDDMGRKPSSKHSIDRIDNDGDYEPGNCRWATSSQQARNTSGNRILSVFGEQMTLIEAAERYGLRYGLVKRRLQMGWDDEQALGLKYRKTQAGGTKLKIPSRPMRQKEPSL